MLLKFKGFLRGSINISAMKNMRLFNQNFNSFNNNLQQSVFSSPTCTKCRFSKLNESYIKTISRTISNYTSVLKSNQKSGKNNSDETDLLHVGDDVGSKDLYKHPDSGHNVLIIQPRMKTGKDWEKKLSAELKLSEAVSLINTLTGWKVVDKLVVPISSLTSSLLFGKGNLEKLKSMLQIKPSISAVFIGMDILKALQNTKLEAYFKVPVFDRYQVILQIFHEHAKTKEAKLQLALAEIPYLRIKLASLSHSRYSVNFSGIQHVGGDGETFMEMRRRLLNERETKLKKALEKIKHQREFLRQSESRNMCPIVAVVGYTNCGKTTLIKSLTNDSRLEPENKLFATLDVTLHPGLLPSSQKCLFIDTVGFISNVPTNLIQSFKSTLEEITVADLVVHVRDISHPDTEAQKETVLKTLQELDLSTKLLDSIIEVRNKIDLIKEPDILHLSNDAINISATEGTGLPNFLEKLEQKLIENTDRNICLLRVPNGGREYSWIRKEATIRDAMADTRDENYLILEVILTSSTLSKFKHEFGDLTVKVDDLKS